MAYAGDELNDVFDRTSGRCHLCGKKLAFKNYGQLGARAAWEVEHSRPRAGGGTNHLNNLYAACIPCNRKKGTLSTRSTRAWHGRTKAPLSRVRRKEQREFQTLAGAVGGAVVGMRFGPVGALLGAVIGGLVGDSIDPDFSQ